MDVEKEIRKIQERNKRVEGDKAWETSTVRKTVITIFTYLIIGIFLWTIKIPDPWLNAVVPAAAFMLSTLTMPYLKKLWMKYVFKNE